MANLKGVDISETAVGNDEGVRKRHEKETGREDAKQMMRSGSAAKQVGWAIENQKNRTLTREPAMEEMERSIAHEEFKPLKRYEGRLSKGRSKGRR